jgi:hypothetical protein
MKGQRLPLREWLEKRFKEPALLLRAAHFFWQETRNPANVWWAIEICTRDGRVEFPGWVRQYLTDCARRMMSPEARQESDLRKIFPKIFDFPTKRGRGSLLDLGWKEANQFFVPAMRFAIEIEKGAKPTAALRTAFEYLDAEVADSMDEKTLLSHIKKQFDMPSAPRTNAEWKRAIRGWFDEAFGPFIDEFRDISS